MSVWLCGCVGVGVGVGVGVRELVCFEIGQKRRYLCNVEKQLNIEQVTVSEK